MILYNVIEFLNNVDELATANTLLNTFEKYAADISQYDELGRCYEKIKQYNNALRMINKCSALAKDPVQMFNIRANLAKVYNHLNEPFKSITQSKLNIEVDPTDYDSKMELSFSYYLCGDIQKSYDIQRDLLQIPDLPLEIKKRIIFNMSTFEMENGNFKGGMYKMVYGGKEIGIWKSPKRPYEKWQGNDISKTLLVFAEAGIGDEFINIRFMRELTKRNIKHHYVGFRKDLVELFKDNGYNAILESDLDPLEDYVYCDAMTIPVLLNIDETQLWESPYLAAKSEYIEKWKKLLPEKFLTIKYSGNPFYDHDLHRSLPIQELLSSLSSLNIPIISLQIENKEVELVTPDIQSWDDTLAIQHLALYNITSCTSTAHSASASGAKCAVISPICRYYPWVSLSTDYTSPWYGKTTKIFPQIEWRDWSGPFTLLKKELEDTL